MKSGKSELRPKGVELPCKALIIKVTEHTFELTTESRHAVNPGSSGEGFKVSKWGDESRRLLKIIEALLQGQEIESIRERLLKVEPKSRLAHLREQICLRVRCILG